MKNHETTLKNHGNQQVLIFRYKQTELHHNIYITITTIILISKFSDLMEQGREAVVPTREETKCCGCVDASEKFVIRISGTAVLRMMNQPAI